MSPANKNKNSAVGISLLLFSSFTFAYSLGVLLHEIGHVLGYQSFGVPTIEFVFQPLGRSFMEPQFEVEGNVALGIVYSAASLFNVLCASLVLGFTWRKQSLMLFPFMMWGATAPIQESIAIILDVANGGAFDWTMVVAAGVPMAMVLLLSFFLMILGCLIFLRLITFCGLAPRDPWIKKVAISISAIAPFFALSLVYSLAHQGEMLFSKGIALGSSLGLAILLSSVHGVSFEFLERFFPVEMQRIERIHVVFPLGLCLVVFLITQIRI